MNRRGKLSRQNRSQSKGSSLVMEDYHHSWESSSGTSGDRSGTYYMMFANAFYGVEGFDELRTIIKKGNEMCREIAGIISERASLEMMYSKGLQKLGIKLTKVCSAGTSTTMASWETVAGEMTAEAETHKQISDSLMDDIYKPLKNMVENHSKVRKPIELAVDKASRTLYERRQEEHKYKLKSFQSTGEAEKLHMSIIEKRVSSKKTPDKELAKMEKKLVHLKEQIRKSGKQYYTACLTAERTRQDWENTSIKCMSQLQQLEEERLKELHKHLRLYKNALDHVPNQMNLTCNRLEDATQCIDFDKDLRKIVECRTQGVCQPEQVLFETYAEDMDMEMEKERRRQALTLFIYLLSQDIQKEQKTVAGLARLSECYRNQPDYADYETVEDTNIKLRQVHATLNFLDASHFKHARSLSIINENEIPQYKFADYIERLTDKDGLPHTVLRVPVSQINDGFCEAEFSARGKADGSHDSPTDGTPYESISQGDSDNEEAYDDEFDVYDDLERLQSEVPTQIISTCEVLYDFNSTQSTELTIRQGDRINLLEKHADGWWKGELHGAVGIFPATYVQET